MSAANSYTAGRSRHSGRHLRPHQSQPHPVPAARRAGRVPAPERGTLLEDLHHRSGRPDLDALRERARGCGPFQHQRAAHQLYSGITYPGQNPLQSGDQDPHPHAAVCLDYRYPFISVENWGTQTIEPRAQLIIRPSETGIGKMPNEDAQSLVFDDSNLFEINKYSGWDRVEGGGPPQCGRQLHRRAQQCRPHHRAGGPVQSPVRLNSFAEGDMANTGLQSGLDSSVSDIVARFSYSPTRNLEFISRLPV